MVDVFIDHHYATAFMANPAVFQSQNDARKSTHGDRKLEASIEAGLVMQKALLNSMSGKQAPWWVTSQRTMKPYHQRSSANSRRLAK
ncbi:hypothetical protein HORIV_05280 [Vreelandella olivaria]|uniref:Uncharacterized protein n=1 Tax=Vreelandella olivaria TaxID=390919 RepID=A0ABM7GBY5_9GAMM|nr:hypothetical protein HORIV_05280 [Halomonas olivaria]